jgi:hypothetical protein
MESDLTDLNQLNQRINNYDKKDNSNNLYNLSVSKLILLLKLSKIKTVPLDEYKNLDFRECTYPNEFYHAWMCKDQHDYHHYHYDHNNGKYSPYRYKFHVSVNMDRVIRIHSIHSSYIEENSKNMVYIGVVTGLQIQKDFNCILKKECNSFIKNIRITYKSLLNIEDDEYDKDDEDDCIFEKVLNYANDPFCAICYENYTDSLECVKIKNGCIHSFCKNCFCKSLEKQKCCPCCRFNYDHIDLIGSQ